MCQPLGVGAELESWSMRHCSASVQQRPSSSPRPSRLSSEPKPAHRCSSAWDSAVSTGSTFAGTIPGGTSSRVPGGGGAKAPSGTTACGGWMASVTPALPGWPAAPGVPGVPGVPSIPGEPTTEVPGVPAAPAPPTELPPGAPLQLPVQELDPPLAPGVPAPPDPPAPPASPPIDPPAPPSAPDAPEPGCPAAPKALLPNLDGEQSDPQCSSLELLEAASATAAASRNRIPTIGVSLKEEFLPMAWRYPLANLRLEAGGHCRQAGKK